MRANRKDSNHIAIVAHARSLGFETWDVSSLKNCCDEVFVRNGKVFFIEIKDGNKPKSAKKLTAGEILFKERMEKAGATHEVVETEADISKLFLKTI